MIKKAVVLHQGWEMDNLAWVIKGEDGELKLMTTSHGSVCSMSIEDLNETIKETKDSLDQLNNLLDVIIKG
jgi:hypothetical protein